MYSSILVPIDLDEPNSWTKAVPVALALADCFGARCTLATVVKDSLAAREAQWSPIAFRELISTADARLSLIAGGLCGDTRMATKVGTGSVCGGIVDLADQVAADLIILASHHPVMTDWLIGANASRVVRHTRCSVLVVRD